MLTVPGIICVCNWVKKKASSIVTRERLILDDRSLACPLSSSRLQPCMHPTAHIIINNNLVLYFLRERQWVVARALDRSGSIIYQHWSQPNPMKMIWDTLLLLLATSAFFCFPSLSLKMMTTKGEIHWLNNLFISTSLSLRPTLAGSPFSSYHKIK